jgi:hypothetical protein
VEQVGGGVDTYLVETAGAKEFPGVAHAGSLVLVLEL